MISKKSKIKLEYHGTPETITQLGIHQLKMDFSRLYDVPVENIEVEKKFLQVSSIESTSLGDTIKEKLYLGDKRKMYQQYFDTIDTKEINLDDFFKLDNTISSLTKADINKRKKFRLKKIDAKNILSYSNFQKDFTSGIEIIQSIPQNGSGKSNFMNICKIGIFGCYRYSDGGTTTKFSEIINDKTKESSAYINTLIEVDGNDYLISRVFEKTKNNISHNLLFIKVLSENDKGVTHFFDTNRKELILPTQYNRMRDGFWCENLTSKNTDDEIQKLTGTIDDLYYSAILDNTNKWLITKPTERYKLFYDYFGLNIFIEKQNIAKVEYLNFRKKSKLGGISVQDILNENTNLENEITSIGTSISIMEDTISKEQSKVSTIDAKITEINKSYNQIPDIIVGYSGDSESKIISLTNDIEDTKKIINDNQIDDTKQSKISNKPILIENKTKLQMSLTQIDTSEFDKKITNAKVEFIPDTESISQLEKLKTEKDSLTTKWISLNSEKKTLVEQLSSIGDSIVCEHCKKTIYETLSQKTALSNKISLLDNELSEVASKGKEVKAQIEVLESHIETKKKDFNNEVAKNITFLEKDKQKYISESQSNILSQIETLEAEITTIVDIEKALIENQRLTMVIELKQKEIQSENIKITTYNDYLLKIEENKQKDSEVEHLTEKKKQYEDNIRDLTKTLNQFISDSKSKKILVDKNIILLSELENDIKKDNLYNFYIKVHEKEGLP